ncbi:MAG: rod shape-determining protein RodA [Bordetella sp.]|nr:MAG: rod shape-determining protein RodA [Bordetella sp.]
METFKANNYKKIFTKLINKLDWPLLFIVILFIPLSLVIISSAVGSTDWRIEEQFRNFLIAFSAILFVAIIDHETLIKLSPIFYMVGLFLLLCVEFFGETSKGATRWLNIGIARIQPSEILKISAPMFLAWYFHHCQRGISKLDFFIAITLLIIPCFLIVLQPDLGTALLVFIAGVYVIYFSGLSFKFLFIPISIGILIFLMVYAYQDQLCKPEVNWFLLHKYQKNRICTLLDPNSDPLGKGFHTAQSVIAVGSGGLYGKGYKKGTQTQLNFIPERATDFVFSVFAEEFGLYGSISLIFLYGLLIIRGFFIAIHAKSEFGRLLVAALTMMIFTYVFVNLGMVTGILPIVGIPLPFVSYGGTALLTMGISCGIMMNVSKHKRLIY